MKYGLIKVAAAVPGVRVADVEYNVQQMESLIAQAEGRGAEIIVFPQLSLTGYSCEDLFHQQLLNDNLGIFGLSVSSKGAICELNTSHWAIKERDIFRSLKRVGVVVPEI